MKHGALVAGFAVTLFSVAGQTAMAQAPWPGDDSDAGQYPQQQPAYSPSYQPSYPAQGYGQPQSYSNQAPAYGGYGQGQQNYQGQGYPQPVPPQARQPMSPDQLEQLVAPIALYPDALLAQILAASTYPAQISSADQWLGRMGYAPPEQIAAAANMQTAWDPSVKALTAFPQVLNMLDRNLQWTTALGNAYYNQPQDVLQTVQVMRQRAEQAGNLQSTPQENVIQQQGYIALAPVQPEMVYVPTYNPWTVYGQPVSPYPGFSFFGALGSFFGSSPVHYGLSFALSAFQHPPFGLLSWGLDWLANSILFNHSNYFTHSTTVADWGLPRGGPRAWRSGPSMARFGAGGYHHEPIAVHPGLNRATYPYARSGQGFNHLEAFNRDFQRGEYSRAFPQQQAYSRMPEAVGRPQPYESRGQSFAARPEPYRYVSPAPRGPAYAPAQGYRAPASNFAHNDFRRAPSEGFRAQGNAERSGGFHPFGGGQKSESFGHAPKNFGGGHGAGKAPKASHSGGGHSHGHGR